jgi:hypothetical protein
VEPENIVFLKYSVALERLYRIVTPVFPVTKPLINFRGVKCYSCNQAVKRLVNDYQFADCQDRAVRNFH